MQEKIDLPKSIPIFPLPKAVLLPRSRLPLHIFEPRYLAMIEDCMKTPNRLIGMVQPTGANDRLHSICLLYTSPSPRDQRGSRMPSSA